MSNFFLRLEAIPGRDILRCSHEAINLANKLELTVTFDFNGVRCMACPGDNPESLAKETLTIMTRDYPHNIARGRP